MRLFEFVERMMLEVRGFSKGGRKFAGIGVLGLAIRVFEARGCVSVCKLDAMTGC